jgi:hypothetical protein
MLTAVPAGGARNALRWWLSPLPVNFDVRELGAHDEGRTRDLKKRKEKG